MLSVNSTNSYINAEEKLVAAIGLDDVVIVKSRDAILVSKKSVVQQVKKIIE